MTHPITLELPRPWLPVVVATYIALGILFVGVAGVQWLLVALAGYYAEELPHYEFLRTPMFGLMFSGGLCVQLGVVATAVLVARVRSTRILEPRALRWVDVLIGTVTVAGLITVALVVVLRIVDALPPGAMLILVLGGVGLLVLDLLLLVLRSLLHRAIILRAELDEVV
jgi:hypothetical protein